jgi:hypothetical protein
MTQLENLKTAVENDDKAQALRIVPDLVGEFEERRTVEDSRIKLAKTAKRPVERGGEGSELASEYLKATAEASEARTRLNSSLYGYFPTRKLRNRYLRTYRTSCPREREQSPQVEI